MPTWREKHTRKATRLMTDTPAPDSTSTDADAAKDDSATASGSTTEDATSTASSTAADDTTPLTSVEDFGDGPDGDPVDGETREQQLKRIGRREKKERVAAERARDEALTEAQVAKELAAQAQATADELTQTKTKVETLTEQLGKAELTNLKYEVGSQAGLTLAQCKRLQGTSKQELVDDAKQFIRDNGVPGLGVDGERQVPDDAESRRRFVERMRTAPV